MLPHVSSDFGIVQEPELRFNNEGQAWCKVRVVAKDRAYNAETKVWEDKGDPCYLDLLVSGKAAENLYESVKVGDSIVVTGRLQQREWSTNEGEKRVSYQIRADSVGVNVIYSPLARKDIDRPSAPAVPQDTEAPF